MNINCEILDIRIFLAIIDFGGFQRAAEVLSLSQPTLTRRVQMLETSLGAKLFNRSTRQVSVTRAGRDVEVHFRRIAREFENCLVSLTDFGVKPSGVLTIACLETLAAAFLPSVLRVFQEKYPDIRFRIRDATAQKGLDFVANGEAEFGVSSLGFSRQELVFTPFFDEQFALACRADHPIAAKKRIRWQDIQDLPLIVSVRSNSRILIDQALAKSGLNLNWSYQISHLSASFGLIEEGLGMAVMPILSRPLIDHPIIRIIPLEDPVVKRTIGFIEAKNRQLSRTAEELKETIRNYANQIAVRNL